jgi:ABC-type Fe3+/spermidine/putrescine transport system ATPase subunit
MPRHGTLVVEDLHMTYKTAEGPVRAVRGVSFTVEPGEFYTLLGASGCGKTTILTRHGPIICPAGHWVEGEDSVWIACRPEGVMVTAAEPQGENVFTGRITAAFFAGEQIIYSINIGQQMLQAKSDPFRSFQEGDRVCVQLPPERCLLIRHEHDPLSPPSPH